MMLPKLALLSWFVYVKANHYHKFTKLKFEDVMTHDCLSSVALPLHWQKWFVQGCSHNLRVSLLVYLSARVFCKWRMKVLHFRLHVWVLSSCCLASVIVFFQGARFQKFDRFVNIFYIVSEWHVTNLRHTIWGWDVWLTIWCWIGINPTWGRKCSWSCFAAFPFCHYTGCQVLRLEPCATGMCF